MNYTIVEFWAETIVCWLFLENYYKISLSEISSNVQLSTELVTVRNICLWGCSWAKWGPPKCTEILLIDHLIGQERCTPLHGMSRSILLIKTKGFMWFHELRNGLMFYHMNCTASLSNVEWLGVTEPMTILPTSTANWKGDLFSGMSHVNLWHK